MDLGFKKGQTACNVVMAPGGGLVEPSMTGESDQHITRMEEILKQYEKDGKKESLVPSLFTFGF